MPTDNDESCAVVQSFQIATAHEHKILALAALDWRRETEAGIRYCIGRFGRLRWAERRMLWLAGIDADAIHVEQTLRST